MRKYLASPIMAAALLLFAAPIFSQKPDATTPKPALATPEKPESTEPPVKRSSTSRRHLDARECLRLPTNMEIHRCSLKYL
jgi:hypothetical protein